MQPHQSSYFSSEICRWKDQKKLAKALRQYDSLLARIPDHDTEKTEVKVKKIYSRTSRMHEMSHLYTIIIFNELDRADEYFREMNSVLIHKNKAHAYYELKQKCKEINQIDSSGSNALLLTVLKGSYLLFELLITHGADFKLKYENKMTLLHLATICENYEIVKLLLDFEAFVAKTDDDLKVK